MNSQMPWVKELFNKDPLILILKHTILSYHFRVLWGILCLSAFFITVSEVRGPSILGKLK